MARNSADVVDHEIDAMLSAGDHDQDEADALAAISASWFDDSERTDVLQPRHLMGQLLPQPLAAVEPRTRESESGQRPIHRPEPELVEDPKWDEEQALTSIGEIERATPWEEPDLSGEGEWEEAQTAYFERTANFELLDSKFVSEYTDRLPGGLSELLSSDAESEVVDRPKPQRKSGVRESRRMLPNSASALEAPDQAERHAREVSAHFAYEVSPEAQPAPKHTQRSAPAASRPMTERSSKPPIHRTTIKRRPGSETTRERGRATTVRPGSMASDPIDFDSDALEFDEASVATARGGRRFAPTADAGSQRPSVAQRMAAAPSRVTRPVPSQPAPKSSLQTRASQLTAEPAFDSQSLRPLVARSTRPSEPGALPVAAEYDSEFAELREQRRHQVAAWVWLMASALSGVALILVIRAWTAQPFPLPEPLQQPSVALETTVSAAQQAEPSLSITSRPEGAQIFVDGKATGFITPASIKQLSPGLHSVELKLDGYYDTTLPAALQEHGTLELAPVEMRQRPQPFASVAAAVPTGAIVPKLAAAAPSHAKTREARRGHRHGISRNAPVRGLDDSDTDSASAANGAGTLRINSRPWARVMIDNKFVGNTPQRGLKVAAGEHSVKLVNEPLNMSKTFRVNVHDGETVTRVEMLNDDSDQTQTSR
jgi:hypothetical protein